MKTWIIDYYYNGIYRKKVIKAETAQQAIKKSRLNKSIIDINERKEK